MPDLLDLAKLALLVRDRGSVARAQTLLETLHRSREDPRIVRDEEENRREGEREPNRIAGGKHVRQKVCDQHHQQNSHDDARDGSDDRPERATPDRGDRHRREIQNAGRQAHRGANTGFSDADLGQRIRATETFRVECPESRYPDLEGGNLPGREHARDEEQERYDR